MGNKPLFLDKNIDLYISMVWSEDNKHNKKHKHGISGHLYEMLDYYLLLKKYITVKLLICEEIEWNTIYRAIVSKYDLDDQEITEIRNDLEFADRPRFVSGRNILFVDGSLLRGFVYNRILLSFKNIIVFRCSPLDTIHNLPYDNITLLQDNRIYNGKDNEISKHYIKKILFSRYKDINKTKTNTAMLYLTSNCRLIKPEVVDEIINKNKFERYLIVTNTPYTYKNKLKSKNLEILEAPVDDIFNRFETYIYTGIKPNYPVFDCSPRFIPECKFYDKSVIYETSYELDIGTKTRIHDTVTDFDSLVLNDNDMILQIVKEML